MMASARSYCLLLGLLCLVPAMTLAADRAIAPGDRFVIASDQISDLNCIRSVDQAGTLSIPLVGSVPIAHANEAQAERILSQRASLALGRLVDVHLTGLRPRDRRVSLTGAVGSPTGVFVKSGLRTADLVGLGAAETSADLSDIRVSRIDGSEVVVDLVAGDDILLRAGDRVNVPQAAESLDVVIVGGVRNPGTQRWRPGLSLADAIMAAGGLSPHARGDLATIRRANGPAEPFSLTAAASVILRRGDQIGVMVVDRPEFVTLTGLVRNPGLVPYRKGTILSDLIDEAGGIIPGAGNVEVVVSTVAKGRKVVRKFALVQALAMSGAQLNLAASDSVELRPKK